MKNKSTPHAFEEQILSRITFEKEYYEKIKSFYRYVYDCTYESFDLIILTTRRSYILYKIFERVFGVRSEEEKKNLPRVINNHAIEVLRLEDTLKKRVLIVDDILINGRAVKNLKTKLEQMQIAKLEVLVFAFNRSAKVVRQEDPDYLFNNANGHGFRIVTEEEWQNYSSFCNELALISGLGYISFVDSFVATESNAEEKINLLFQQGIDNINRFFIDNQVYREKKISAEVMFLDKDSLLSSLGNRNIQIYKYLELLNSLNFEACIRKYRYPCYDGNNISYETVIIPYVFLPDMRKDQLCQYGEKIFSCFPVKQFKIGKSSITTQEEDISKDTQENVSNIWYQIFSAVKESGKYLYMLLTKICSRYLLHLLSEALNIKKGIADRLLTDSDMCLSFFFDDSCKFHSEPIDRFPLVYSQNYYHCLEQGCRVELANAFEDITQSDLDDFDKLNERVSQYLFRMRTVDEHHAEKQEERENGVRLEDIIKLLKEKRSISFSREKYSRALRAILINCWDCGKGSLVVRDFVTLEEGSKTTYICGSLINGEQIFLFPIWYDNGVGYEFSCFSNWTGIYDPIGLKKFAEHMDHLTDTLNYTLFLSTLRLGKTDDYYRIINNYSVYPVSTKWMRYVFQYAEKQNRRGVSA